jgi:hypothetical protein
MELIYEALKDHEEIIYCDWDVRCSVKSKEAFQAIQNKTLLLSLVSYSVKKHLWDTPNQYKEDKIFTTGRLTVSGCFIYTVGKEWITEVLERMKEPHIVDGPIPEQNWHDEWVMTRILNEKHGGWIGEEEWLKTYESPIMVQRKAPWHDTLRTKTTIQRETKIPFTWTKMFYRN